MEQLLKSIEQAKALMSTESMLSMFRLEKGSNAKENEDRDVDV